MVLATSGAARLEQVAWTLGDDHGWAWVARYPRSARMTIHPAPDVADLPAIVTPAEGESAINGGFYDDGPMGLVRHDGRDVAPRRPGGGSGIAYWGPDLLLTVVHRDAWAGSGTEALQSIDRLVDRGASLVQPAADARITARVAVITLADGVALVVAADDDSAPPTGRTRILRGGEDHGLPLWAFADLLVHLGAREALNLDGGISVAFDARMGGEAWTVGGGAGTINAVRLSLP